MIITSLLRLFRRGMPGSSLSCSPDRALTTPLCVSGTTRSLHSSCLLRWTSMFSSTFYTRPYYSLTSQPSSFLITCIRGLCVLSALPGRLRPSQDFYSLPHSSRLSDYLSVSSMLHLVHYYGPSSLACSSVAVQPHYFFTLLVLTAMVHILVSPLSSSGLG